MLKSEKNEWRVVVYGKHSETWSEALGLNAPVWDLLPQVKEVVVDEFASGNFLNDQQLKTFVLPLMENHIRQCPLSYYSTIPSSEALKAFANKALFSKYVQGENLLQFCPRTYDNDSEIEFPCVIKRTDLNCGNGVRVLHSNKELDEARQEPIWRDYQYIVQSYIPGREEFSTYCVCKNGKIQWHTSYSCLKETEQSILCANVLCQRGNFHPLEEQIKQMQKFLLPVSYTGVCNIDYKLDLQGDIVVFEINPRLGGSLMRPQNVTDLAVVISQLLTHATSTKGNSLISHILPGSIRSERFSNYYARCFELFR